MKWKRQLAAFRTLLRWFKQETMRSRREVVSTVKLRRWQREQRRWDGLQGCLRINGQDFVTGFEEKERERGWAHF